MNQTQDLLRQVFQTRNRLTFPVSGTGSAGMEACIMNLLEPGDRALICINGVFGQRMAEVARRAGARVHTIERSFGEVFEPAALRNNLHEVCPKVLGIVHAETSTGARQPIEEIASFCRQTDTLLLVDAVTSLGGMPLDVDGWGIDAVYSGTQKCLSCPPGLAPVSFSDRAAGVMRTRTVPVPSWYLDVSLVERYWAEERFYHHTAPITMIYALHEALRLVLEEGLEQRWRRHELNHRALRAGLAAVGISYATASGHELPMLNAIRIPLGADDAGVRKSLLDDFGIEIGGGLGDFKGKVWRVGLMGHGSRRNNVLLFLAALEQCLQRQGVSFPCGSSVEAANQVYLETN
jgi:alanine-glyoxylate transaminase/serine-glyoxylate transaminase/serine-pyruvate transaminase